MGAKVTAIENQKSPIWAMIRGINMDFGRNQWQRRRMRYCMSCEVGIGIMAHREIPVVCPWCRGCVTFSDTEIVKGLRERHQETEAERRARKRGGEETK